jgi:hypothetical protein
VRNASLSHAAPAFELDRPTVSFFQYPRAGGERLLLRLLVGAERHVNHHQRSLGAAHHRVTLQDHHVERDRHGGLKPMHDHAERIPNQDDVAILVDQARGVGVIRGQAHDRLGALARPDIGRGQPLDLLLHGHGQLPNTGLPMTNG